ncbi:TPA: Dot/Icm T4SS effector Lem9, partial [Legionella pneumophila subsp. pneumophila]|nr:Dot/Icm T4SS effector Lem9 [Legionella pneumophila subsp. pneumophila]
MIAILNLNCQKQNTLLLRYKIMKHLAELKKLKEKCLEMSDKEFNYCFNKGDTSQRSIGTIIARLMNRIDLKDEFFKTDKDYVDWIEDVISARKKAALSPSSTPVSMDKKTPDSATELAKIKEKCLNMNEKEFNYCFNKGDASERGIALIIARLKNAVGLKDEFFKTDKDYVDWIEDIISARKKAALSPSSTPVSMDKKTPDSATELAKIKEQLLKMKDGEFDYYVKDLSTDISNGGISISRRLLRDLGLKGEFFKTQKDYNEWIDDVISTRKFINFSANIDNILNKFEEKIKNIGTNYPEAKIKANDLLMSLRKNKDEAFSNPSLESLYDFADKSKQMIKSTISSLERESGSVVFLSDLAEQILNTINTFLNNTLSSSTSSRSGFFGF